MATVIVFFNLKDGASAAKYEAWARERDSPVVNALPSVDSFRLQIARGLIGSDAASPYHYVEIIEITNLDAFMSDIATDEMVKIATEFREFADAPTFILTEPAS